MENSNLKPGTKLVFSDKTVEIIWDLIEKYNLNKKILEGEGFKEKLKYAEDSSARRGFQIIFSDEKDEVPFIKLKGVAEELFEKKIKFEDLPEILKQKLNISLKTSKELAKDMESYFSLSFEKEKFIEKNTSFSYKKKPLFEENIEPELEPKIKEKENFEENIGIIKREEEKNHKGKDSYRELLE